MSFVNKTMTRPFTIFSRLCIIIPLATSRQVSDRNFCREKAGTSAGFWLARSMPPCRLRRNFFLKIYYEMVHSDVYLNKYSAVLYTCLSWLISKYNINIENCSFCMFSLFNSSIHILGGSADPICFYVRTPMWESVCYVNFRSIKWGKPQSLPKFPPSYSTICTAI